MGIDTVDKRFALIAKDGAVHYPYKKHHIATNRYGFALSKPGGRDDADAEYTLNIEVVVRKVVLEGWKVRAMAAGKPGGSVGIEKLKFPGYWISDELKHLVAGAKMAPSPMPGLSPVGSHPSTRNFSPHLIVTMQEPTVASSNTPDEKEEENIESLSEDLADRSLLADLDEIDAGTADENDLTERLGNRMCRLGQGEFRKNTIATWGDKERCAVTGISIREVLTASHIIPWAEDVGQRKRGCNGILLAAHLDRLFDRHLIGFRASSEAGIFSLVVAPCLADRFLNLAPLGVTTRTTLDLSTVNPKDRSGLEKNLGAHLDIVLGNL